MNPSNTAINWKDDYYSSKDRVVLTNAQIHIPGVRVLGHHLMTNAIKPLQLHYHEDSFEFTIIYEGIFIFQAGNKDYKAAGGEIFVAYPNEPHSTNQFPLSHGEFYWFQLDTSSLRKFLFLDEDAARDLISRLNRIRKHVVKVKDDAVFSLFKHAFELSLTASSPYLAASYLVLFLNLLCSISAEQQTLSKEIYHALNFIYDHIYMDISLENLAACSNLSVPQFKVRFKQEVGISPRSFINMQKVESAKHMLLEGLSKTEVALQLGFNTSSYFAAVFKKYTFYTPTEYIKAHSSKTE